jgi:hypothetical protein
MTWCCQHLMSVPLMVRLTDDAAPMSRSTVLGDLAYNFVRTCNRD